MQNRSSKPKRPRDLNKLAKAIVDISGGEAPPVDPDEGGAFFQVIFAFVSRTLRGASGSWET